MENEIKVAGDWSIFGISRKIPLLIDELRGLAAGKRAVIDLSDVEEIDVCGWQLLSILIRHCRHAGMEPVMVNLRSDLRDRIRLLGFGGEFRFTHESGEAA